MLDQREHDIVKQAMDLIKRELTEMAPSTPEDKPGKLAFYKFGTFVIKMCKPRRVVSPAAGGELLIPARLAVRSG